MATKAESRHAEEQRKGPTPKARKRAKAKKTTAERGPHEAKRAGKKASYAAEAAPKTKAKASRKSTRKSANRSKSDTNLTLRAERRTRSADTRARKAKARKSRVRGSSSS